MSKQSRNQRQTTRLMGDSNGPTLDSDGSLSFEISVSDPQAFQDLTERIKLALAGRPSAMVPIESWITPLPPG